RLCKNPRWTSKSSMRKRRFFLLSLPLFAITLLISCHGGAFVPECQSLPAQLATYEPMSIPADNPLTPEKVALGRQLFFDERLSVDGTKSCYSCHVCENGLTEGLQKEF